MVACRRLLGKHVWQTGAKKDVDRTRLDITHPKRLTVEETESIEMLANRVVMEDRSINTFWLKRD